MQIKHFTKLTRVTLELRTTNTRTVLCKGFSKSFDLLLSTIKQHRHKNSTNTRLFGILNLTKLKKIELTKQSNPFEKLSDKTI
jgi:hypothetical protein